MSSLLQYALISHPFPLVASPASGPATEASLTLVATNATSASVPFEEVAIRLPVGDGATQLTPDDVGIQVEPPDHWKLDETQRTPGYVEFFFVPDQGYASVGANKSMSFIFNNLTINRVIGTAEIVVTEQESNGVDEERQHKLPITKFPPDWQPIRFEVEHTPVGYGDKPALGWAGPAGATYSINYYTPATGVVVVPAAGEDPLGSSGRYVGPALYQLTIFTLVVELHPYVARTQQLVQVQIPGPVIQRLAIEPADVDVDQPIPEIKLVWQTEHVGRLYLRLPDLEKVDYPATNEGAHVIRPKETRSYRAEAHGMEGYAGATDEKTAWVTFVHHLDTGYVSPYLSNYSYFILKVSGQEVFELKIEMQNPGYDIIQEIVVLPERVKEAGVQVANLGIWPAGTHPGYRQVESGNYGTVVEHEVLWLMNFDREEQYTVNVGAAWGIQFADKRYALLWYTGAEHDEQTFSFRKWKFNFQWILYPSLLANEDDSADTLPATSSLPS